MWLKESLVRILRMWCQSRRKGLMFLVMFGVGRKKKNPKKKKKKKKKSWRLVAFMTLPYKRVSADIGTGRSRLSKVKQTHASIRAFIIDETRILWRWACFACRALSVDNVQCTLNKRDVVSMCFDECRHFSLQSEMSSTIMKYEHNIISKSLRKLNFISFFLWITARYMFFTKIRKIICCIYCMYIGSDIIFKF